MFTPSLAGYVLCGLPDTMEQLATCTGVHAALPQRRNLIGRRPFARLWLRTLARDLRRLNIGHLRSLSDIDALNSMAELNGYAIGVVSVNRMNETVVNHLRNIKPRSRYLSFEFPEVFFGFHAKGDVIKDEGARNRPNVFLFSYRLYFRPSKKGNEIGFRNLEEIMPVSRSPETGYPIL